MPVTMNFNGELLLCFVFLKTVHELVLSSSVVSSSLRPCTVACQAPLSVEFSKQEYWRGLPFPPPGHFPDPGIKPTVSFMTSLFHLSLDRYNRKYKKAWKIAYKLGTVQLDSITDMNLGKLWEMVKGREALCAAGHVVAESQTWLGSNSNGDCVTYSTAFLLVPPSLGNHFSLNNARPSSK